MRVQSGTSFYLYSFISPVQYFKKMTSTNEFEDKATRLLNRLAAVSNPVLPKAKVDHPKISLQEISRLKEQLESSDIENRKRLKGLGDTLRRLQGSLVEQSQVRAQKDEAFNQTISKLQKNMKTALTNVHRGFAQREKKLAEKIDLLIKTERKDLQGRLRQNEEIIDQMEGLQSKIAAIAEEVTSLRRARIQLEERINKQFAQQLKELKRIFEADIRVREERQGKVIQTLKGVYKNGMERILLQERQREESEKLLMTVIQQLVDHIIEV